MWTSCSPPAAASSTWRRSARSWTSAPRCSRSTLISGRARSPRLCEQGAQIVLAGRITDTSLALGPLVHEFGWAEDAWDLLAAGTIAGHIIECGAQATGGNFTRWWEVPELWDVGYPVLECAPDGSFVVTKHAGTGGLVSTSTVAEQLVYEMGDPHAYITPDCVADFGSARLAADGDNRVRVSGIRGEAEDRVLQGVGVVPGGVEGVGAAHRLRPARGGQGAPRRRDRLEAPRPRRGALPGRGPRHRAARHRRVPPRAGRRARPTRPKSSCTSRSAREDRAAVTRFGYELAPLVTSGPPGRHRLRRRPPEGAGGRRLLAGAGAEDARGPARPGDRRVGVAVPQLPPPIASRVVALRAPLLRTVADGIVSPATGS